MKMFIIFLFQSSRMPFYGIDRIQFKCKLCKDNNICYGNFHHISVPEFIDAIFYGICRIQFKCKLCKDYNICYESFHHFSVPEFMDAFFYGIYKNKFKCKLCKERITFILKIFIIFQVFQSSWMPSFTVFNLNVNCVKTITFVMEIFIIFLL